MSTRRTLALLDAILAEVERHRGDGVLTLPVVHDALSPEEDLIAGAAEHMEGAFIQVADREEGAKGPINRPLADLVVDKLTRSRLDARFDEVDGRVIGCLIDHPEPSGGLEVLLRLSEVLVSAEIDQPVVFISYPLAGMDTTVARLAWELTGMTTADSPPSSLRTFVPIAAGEVSVSAHCKPQVPVRFAVQQDRIVARGRSTDLDAAIRAVVLQREQPLVLFLGAGASASAGVSVGDTVRDDALRSLVGQQPTVEGLVEAFLQHLDARDRWRPGEKDLTLSQFKERLTLERVLREEFHSLAGRPLELATTVQRLQAESASALERLPDGRQALRRLVERLPRLVIATINFDQLIEHELPGAHQVLADRGEFESERQLVVDRVSGQTDVVPILKLHGTIERPDSLVATVDKTEFGLPVEMAATLDAMLQAAGEGLTWVWVGCSMRDIDLRMWLGKHDGAKELTEWWVDPLPSQTLFEYARHFRESHWATVGQTLKDRLITETSDVFLPRLDDHVASL